MDWLSRLLEITPVTGRVDIRCEYGAPWRVEFQPAASGEIPYHVVLSGAAEVQDPAGGQPKRLEAGDIILFPQGAPHVLHDGGGAQPAPVRERMGLNLVVSENFGDGERLDMLCGHFAVAPPYDQLLRRYLPGQLVVRARGGEDKRDETAAQLAGMVQVMRLESAADRLGGRAMLNALSTAMFALTLRSASEAGDAPMGLLALVGAPRLAPALTALFREPARPWTLPELARLCHMSRATMARHFKDQVGRSANDLLTDIRMMLAAQELRKPSTSTAAVAAAVGYQSEAAFQRAFKQRMGMTPAAWRRVGGAARAS